MSNVPTSDETQYPISRALDAYRACPAVEPTRKDEAIIAALVTDYGGEAILQVIREVRLKLGAQENSLSYLVGCVTNAAKRGELRAPIQRAEPEQIEEPMDPEQRRENITRLNVMVGGLAKKKAL